jgi:aminoglycoside phosphotransferase (APT) family kinase protein
MTSESPLELARRDPRITMAYLRHGAESLVVKLSIEPDEFAREARARELLAAAGLPVLPALAYQPLAPSTLTVPWVPGTALNSEFPTAVRREVGALLARLHRLDAPIDFGGNETWSAWLAGWSSHAADWWRSADPGARDDASALHAAALRLGPTMDSACRGAILFDGRPDHFIVDADQTIQLIDVEELRRGDPAMDIAVLSVWLPRIIPDVVAGYLAEGGVLGTDFAERVAFYTTLRTLAAAEWHRAELGDERTARELLKGLKRPPAPVPAH